MGKVITVWGSPGSGKSMFSCILAKALTRDKRKAIIINAEISVPMLPVWLPEQIIQTNASVGQVLSSVEIDTSLVAGHVSLIYPQSRFRHLGDKKASMTKGKTPVVHSYL